MPTPNIFGLSKEGLTNPLTEDLQGADFNIYDINELHINELHDQDGTGPIVVHESLNMTNKQITNMSDPTQNKDAATKQYVDNAVGSGVYDVYAAFGDEITPIVAGVQPVTIQIPRAFNVEFVRAYLSVATTSAISFQVYYYGSQLGSNQVTIPAGSTASSIYTFAPLQFLNEGDRITIWASASDATAAGLKVSLLGETI
jgi:hypothetical protein